MLRIKLSCKFLGKVDSDRFKVRELNANNTVAVILLISHSGDVDPMANGRASWDSVKVNFTAFMAIWEIAKHMEFSTIPSVSVSFFPA